LKRIERLGQVSIVDSLSKPFGKEMIRIEREREREREREGGRERERQREREESVRERDGKEGERLT
jgi:hypothetical protein